MSFMCTIWWVSQRWRVTIYEKMFASAKNTFVYDDSQQKMQNVKPLQNILYRVSHYASYVIHNDATILCMSNLFPC